MSRPRRCVTGRRNCWPARPRGRKQWAAEHPALPVLAERCQQLADEVERLRALLRQHGIDPQDKPA